MSSKRNWLQIGKRQKYDRLAPLLSRLQRINDVVSAQTLAASAASASKLLQSAVAKEEQVATKQGKPAVDQSDEPKQEKQEVQMLTASAEEVDGGSGDSSRV